MPETKPVKYKKEYREALHRFNERKGLNIPESDIGNLTIWKQISAVATLEESNHFTVEYLDIVKEVQKEFDHNFKLKALHILNERTGRNIPDEWVEQIQQAYNFPGAESHNDIITTHNQFVDIKDELRNKAKMAKAGKLIPDGYQPCGRCGGSGSYSWNQRDGSTCYGCSGKGIVPIPTKKKSGKGWHGDNPGHKAASIKAETNNVLRQAQTRSGDV